MENPPFIHSNLRSSVSDGAVMQSLCFFTVQPLTLQAFWWVAEQLREMNAIEM